ncbi:MAG: DUF4258 domain-containing protein [Nitrospinae bacterium]|nr:DUF4258 domain-containing protein [Nitrospinota bacterium]
MKKRGITTRQVITVLRSGELMQDPFLDLNHGTWKCDVHGFSAGVNMQVVIAIEPNETNIQVITVYKVGK